VQVAVDVEILNAMLLPLVLGFLLALEIKALPHEQRTRGPLRAVVTSLCVLLMALGVYVVVPSL